MPEKLLNDAEGSEALHSAGEMDVEQALMNGRNLHDRGAKVKGNFWDRWCLPL